MQVLLAEKALTSDGWQRDVRVHIDQDGKIAAVQTDVQTNQRYDGAADSTDSTVQKVGILLPAPVNLHSHAFQRAMAGMSEHRGPRGSDSFWTWRNLMYRFVEQLTPEDVETIAAFVQMEMLEAGYSAVCEFHYVHHQRDGTSYNNIAQMSEAIVSAADLTGIGLTLLPVLYQFGGCDERPLSGGQLRFGNSLEQYGRLHEAATAMIGRLGNHAKIGVAPHSLRATNKEGLDFVTKLAPGHPVHLHLAEQTGEVEEVLSHRGKRPVEWLLENHRVDRHWCFIHLTHMNQQETSDLAKTGAVAGLCPITESSLGDGIFNGNQFISEGGRFGVGSDSNIYISLSEELRTLEYSQRLRDRQRAVLATRQFSTGRVLFGGAANGGAQAAGRNCGAIEIGRVADLVALDAQHTDLFLKDGDDILDSFIFAGNDQMISDVWSGGQHLVRHGRHIKHHGIKARYKNTLKSLQDRM